MFTRYPSPGRNKTRLIPALGEEGAAALHRAMAEHTTAQARLAASVLDAEVEVRIAGAEEHYARRWLGNGVRYSPQREGSLGERMNRAFLESFGSGGVRIVLIGTDCPALRSGHIQAAIELLRQHPLVLGPAQDGGYYLIGLNRPAPCLFQNVAWGESDVFRRTTQMAQRAGLSWALIEELADIDRPEDLPAAQDLLRRSVGHSISVIIPALNEAEGIGACIESARQWPSAEIIVSDGGSRDETVALARAHGARVLIGRPNRGAQMNAGARVASGDVLVFLHADTLLPPGYQKAVRRVLVDPVVSAGVFTLNFDDTGGLLRWTVRWANLRARRMQLPYGDQALFLRREVFERVGGYACLPILEDVDLVRRLRKIGKIATANAPVVSSSRRYLEVGVVRTALQHQLIMLAHGYGWSPERIVQVFGNRMKEGTRKP